MNLNKLTSVFFNALSITTCNSSSEIKSAFFWFAARFIAREISSFPTYYSGKCAINLITYDIIHLRFNIFSFILK